MILLDTDICIEILRGNTRVLAARRRTREEVAISFMTVGELYFGAFRSARPAENSSLIELFLLSVSVIESAPDIMKHFGALKDQLGKAAKLVPDADLLIAATCLKRCSLLVTGNTRHFNRFPGLPLEDWTKA